MPSRSVLPPRLHAPFGRPFVVALLCFVPFALAIAIWVLQETPIVWYDEFEYTKASLDVTTAWSRCFRPGDAEAGLLARLWDALWTTCKTPRPAFHFPAALVLAIGGFSWSHDRVVLLNLALYGPVLFASLAGSLQRLGARSTAATFAACACILCSTVVWHYAGLLMGELPVLALTTALVWACLRLVQEQRAIDFLLLGGVTAWGLFTKPVFAFFAAPLLLAVLVWFLRTRIVRPHAEDSRARSLALATLAVLPPLLVGIALHRRILEASAAIRLMNEEMQAYTESASWLADLAYPLSFLTETFALAPLALLVVLWVAALRRRAGLAIAGLLALLLAYVSFGLHFRNARVFQGLLAGFALLAGLGIESLPRRLRALLSGLLATFVLLMFVVSLAGPAFLDDALLVRRELRVLRAEGGGHALQVIPRSSALPRPGDEYARYHIGTVLERTGVLDAPEREVFVAFGGLPLCASAYQGLAMQRRGQTLPVQFFETGYRYGGWGLPGGIARRFFTADFVLAREDDTGTGSRDSELYTRLYCRELLREDSPLLAGLRLEHELRLPGDERLRVFRRERQPTGAQWDDIVRLLAAEDPDNPWNAKWIAKALAHAEQRGDAVRARELATWILRFAADPDAGPGLAPRFAWSRHFAELRDEYADAWRAARRTLGH